MAISTTIDFRTAAEGALGGDHRVACFDTYIDCLEQNIGTIEVALFDVPERHVFLSCLVEVLTAEGGTATLDVGVATGETGVDIDGFADGVNLNSAAGTVLYDPDAVYCSAGTGGGYVTPNGGNIVSMTVNNALDAAKFRVTCMFLDMRVDNTIMNDVV